MSVKARIKNAPRPLLITGILFVLLCLGLSGGWLSAHVFSEDAKFEKFADQIFLEEVSSNTLNLHYSLANPEEYGIELSPVTLGYITTEDMPAASRQWAQYEQQLKEFDYDRLSEDNRLTLDMLLLYYNTRQSLGSSFLLEEPLSPSLGIQAQLPVLLAEYTFYDTGDISDYLSLLNCVPDYFQSILEFEQEKSQAGCFMSDATLERILEQCQSFVQDPSYMTEVFAEKLEKFSSLKKKDREELLEKHEEILENRMVPAYQNLMAGLKALEGTGKNPGGLANFPGGTSYYQYLLKSDVGVYASVPVIEKRLYQQLMADYQEMGALLKENPALLKDLHSDKDIPGDSPENTLGALSRLCQEDFPALPAASYEVKYVHEALEDFLSPAFYLTPPIDTRAPNTIYINNASRSTNLELFTTLAHEGFPGHLYQNQYFSLQKPENIRYLITSGGYIEGWATYIESYAYGYAEIDSDYSRAVWLNRSINLCLYSILDVGIHYRGWTREQTASFLSAFGITKDSAIEELYLYIVETPANYLKYYLGYLYFQDIKTKAQELQGDSFRLKEFHKKVLEIGPVPFPVLEKYVLE
ncbi:MAG TPA: DUF885 domain-containing protein [Candidatus Blautia avistercoris]|nr:DUF885 domain-containing protein [Candidatus Blautia avistercoris]